MHTRSFFRPGIIPRVLLACTLIWSVAAVARADQAAADFAGWLAGLRQEAMARGIGEPILDAALGGVLPLPEVIALDQRQPEFFDTFLNYLERRVSEQRIEEGQDRLRQHGPLLDGIAARYGVPPVVLIAFWGLETNYGGYLGNFPVPAALATLAHDSRRGEFFRGQLLDALEILQAGHVGPQDMKGSWAGAMGQLQFMPSTFRAYAVDGDGDGRVDLWGSLPDAFASAGNYLNRVGWREHERWGREVLLPEGFDLSQASLDLWKPAHHWARLGVLQADGNPLPHSDLDAAILLPQGHQGPAFLVYPNFRVIMQWNRSVHYAIAVGHLSDRIAWLPPLRNGRHADNRRMTRDQAQELQQRLAHLGFNPGEPDGVIGSRTKAAIRAYQAARGLPRDGHPSHALLEQLQAASPEFVPPSNQASSPLPDPTGSNADVSQASAPQPS
ncbi:MAG: lytic murein transglycosylase [Thiobacillaceae bacterium]|jgi:membrane-bound lytic murein transglycosylase B|nr:lytic murein transglycosylase [Thiobacillaceae bacterium]